MELAAEIKYTALKSLRLSVLNPRYGAYLKTTRSPTNWGYIAFIGKMKRLYLKEFNIQGASLLDHDHFSQFIIDEVWMSGGNV